MSGGEMRGLGINIGSTCVKMCMVAGGKEEWADAVPHEGDVHGTLIRMLDKHGVKPGVHTLVTGPEGRKQVRAANAIEPVALEKALAVLGEKVRAAVSVGGEDLVVYALDGAGRVSRTYAGNKCASGTGEFFSQQLKRMDLNLDAVFAVETAAGTVCRLSSRCSVFMKSDCTHKLNKGEVTKHDIVLSLSNVMARKIIEFLVRARIDGGRVLLAGGSTRNPHLVRFIREGLPGVEFVLPKQAPYLEACGAAYLAAETGTPLPERGGIFSGAIVSYARSPRLTDFAHLVDFIPARRGKLRAGGVYVLGVDGGSTTTKVALIDPDTLEMVVAHYGRTLGDPVASLRNCLREIRGKIVAELGDTNAIRINLIATTGSSRELLGVYCGTPGVYNEILAHTVGTTFFNSQIDTIFEIGGQDAKYVSLRNHVPVDYAMNEACSAGTGSFLEEAAAGDLDIHRAEDIGPIALEAVAPLKFGEHCSAFINSDIRKAIQQDATRADIAAGLVLSIVNNYLNRVVGNRRVGDAIVLQGGVAKNPAVPLAFAAMVGKKITVPPDPELLGAFGVGLIAMQKAGEGALTGGDYGLDELIDREIVNEKEYKCQACENLCPIRIIRVGDQRYHFGGRCNKYANIRKKIQVNESEVTDYTSVRHKLYFGKYAADPKTLVKRSSKVVGIPEVLSVHSLYPLYSHFFHRLGVETRLVSAISERDVARCESSFCYPAEAAHGVMGSLLASGMDWYFLPHFKRMESTEDDVHACLCPLMQGLPYYLRTAFSIPDDRILRPILDFEHGFLAGAGPMLEVAERLGFSRGEALRAFHAAVEEQEACWREGREIGKKVIEEARSGSRPVIVLFGRPYNALTSALNMSVPRKFSTRGYTLLPFDFLPVEDERIFPNMYWYYGQLNMKGATLVKGHSNLFACYITNFSCAPDSFMLHYLRWTFNSKPFLVLELDSHTADAGVDTRVEAFLDIIEGYRKARVAEEPMMVESDWDLKVDGPRTGVIHKRTGEFRGLKHPEVCMLWPSMGRLPSQMISRISRYYGIDSRSLPVSDVRTAARARAVASGKECIPTLLCLGTFLDYFAANPADPEKVYLLFMPMTTGPCRVGQYGVFYQNLFQELGYRNVKVLSLNSDNSYMELGREFSRLAWVAISTGDTLTDMEYALRALALDPAAAKAEFDAAFAEMLETIERDPRDLLRGLPAWAERLARIPLKMTMAEARKVMVVGEIFVRRDDYSVGTLMNSMAESGIVGKIEGLGEWIDYLDWDQLHRFGKRMKAMPWWRRPFSRELRKWLALRLEMLWKDWMEGRVVRSLKPSGLVPEGPSNIWKIISRANSFTSEEFDTEATLSTCTASAAMQDGFHGVAIIAPFACLPGRLVESLYAPWARARDYPVIALENDGNPYPPNVMNRIEVFVHNVKRATGKGTAASG